MAITLNNKTKVTSTVEKLFIEAGGYNPERSLTQEELSSALQTTITALADNKSPSLLKLYRQCVESGDLPDDDEINALSNCID